ncbi:MAG: chemotaxis protein CheD [Lachnospiraceae bacterium]|nr:chemotaxis protein CheD [Lachnospiraceae bacterium]MDD6505372.1 chemotaxis protein CheD [Lachnospiraceae bacterium]
MGEIIKVGMADLKIAKAPDILTTLGLGSCIGLTLYDPAAKIGGLVHYMLPDSTKLKNNTNIAKFGDTGIQELLNQMIKEGAVQRRLVAKIAGGACMFEVSGMTAVGNVGARNTEQAKTMLAEFKIPLIAEDTGLNYGRTVELDCSTGAFTIKAVGKEIKVI